MSPATICRPSTRRGRAELRRSHITRLGSRHFELSFKLLRFTGYDSVVPAGSGGNVPMSILSAWFASEWSKDDRGALRREWSEWAYFHCGAGSLLLAGFFCVVNCNEIWVHKQTAISISQILVSWWLPIQLNWKYKLERVRQRNKHLRLIRFSHILLKWAFNMCDWWFFWPQKSGWLQRLMGRERLEKGQLMPTRKQL